MLCFDLSLHHRMNRSQATSIKKSQLNVGSVGSSADCCPGAPPPAKTSNSFLKFVPLTIAMKSGRESLDIRCTFRLLVVPLASKQPRVTEKVVHSTNPGFTRTTPNAWQKADADADPRRSHFGQDCCQLPTALPSSAFVRRRLVRG